MGQLLSDEREQVRGIHLGAVLQHDGDHHLILQHQRGIAGPDPVRRRLGDRLMSLDRDLDLVGGDVLAAHPQIVVLAIDEEQLAGLVDPDEVARVIPEVPEPLEGRLRHSQ